MSTELIDTVNGVHARCKDCKHYDSAETDSGEGICRRVEQKGLAAIVYQGTSAALAVSHMFGCIQFEPKETT